MGNKFAEKIKNLFGKGKKINDDFYDELTDLLVEGDIGAKASYTIVEELETICSKEKITVQEEILKKLRDLLLQNVKSVDLQPEKDKQNVWMVLGVNSAF